MSVTTAGDIINKALTEILVLGIQDTITALELGDGLDQLNLMLESWSLERLACYALQQNAFALTSGTASYTIGTGGAINVTRPITLYNTFITFQGVTYPMQEVDSVTWDNIPYKATGGIPRALWYDSQFPLGVINIYPVPSTAGMTLNLDSQLLLQQFTDVTTLISLPPGYKRALIKNLAVEMCSSYSRTPAPDLVKLAREAKGNLKRINHQQVLSTFDPAILANRAGYNVWGDSYWI